MTGITERHARSCRSRSGGRCNCDPTHQADVWDAKAERRIRKTFSTRTAAKQWRQDAIVALRQGTLAEAQPKTMLHEACEAWLADARAGIVRRSGGEEYKPGTLRAPTSSRCGCACTRNWARFRSTACGENTYRISWTGCSREAWLLPRSRPRSAH